MQGFPRLLFNEWFHFCGTDALPSMYCGVTVIFLFELEGSEGGKGRILNYRGLKEERGSILN